MTIDAIRKEKDVVEQLYGLMCYASDYIVMSQGDDTCECDDIWCKDYLALKDAMLITKMFYDMWNNLDGQDLTEEMVAILGKLGYEPHEFSRLGICTEQDAKDYIEYFQF